jgi:hypothetical protein
MRLLILLIMGVLIFNTQTLKAQHSKDEIFHIIYVSGEILNKSTNQVLQRGMKIKSEDRLIFKATTSEAIAIGSKRGRFRILLKSEFNKQPYRVGELLFPLKKNSGLSTRDVDMLRGDVYENLSDVFGNDRFYIISNKFQIKINPEKFFVTDSTYFVARYHDGQRVRSKKISYNGNERILTLSKILVYPENENVPIEDIDLRTVSIYWYWASRKISEKIAEFMPIFLDETELISVYQEVYNAVNGQYLDKAERDAIYLDFFRDFYGRTDEKMLVDWLSAKGL